MAETDVAYVISGTADTWEEIAYSAGAAGAFIDAIEAALPTNGGIVLVADSSATYQFSGGSGTIAKSCRVINSPGAIWELDPADAAEATGVVFNGVDGVVWEGGQLKESGAINWTTTRNLLVFNNCDNVSVRDVTGTYASTGGVDDVGAMIKITSGSTNNSACVENCHFVANASGQPSTAYDSVGVPQGEVFIRVDDYENVSISNCHVRGAGSKKIRGFVVLDNVIHATITGCTVNDVALTTDDATGGGLIELIKQSTGEGNHTIIANNYFEVVDDAEAVVLLDSCNYNLITGNSFGRCGCEAAIKAQAGTAHSGARGSALSITANQFHNLGIGQGTTGGFAVWIDDIDDVYLAANQHSLTQASRTPLRIGDGAKNVRLGDFMLTRASGVAEEPFISFDSVRARTQTSFLRDDVMVKKI